MMLSVGYNFRSDCGSSACLCAYCASTAYVQFPFTLIVCIFSLSLTKSLELSRFCLFPFLVLCWVDDKHKSFSSRVECKNEATTAVRRNKNPWQSICFNRFLIELNCHLVASCNRRGIVLCDLELDTAWLGLFACQWLRTILKWINKLPMKWIYAHSVAIYVTERQRSCSGGFSKFDRHEASDVKHGNAIRANTCDKLPQTHQSRLPSLNFLR